jgi:ABC-type transporter Mla MlaB component
MLLLLVVAVQHLVMVHLQYSILILQLAVVEVVKILVDRVNLVDRAAVGVLLHLARVVLVRRDKVFLEVAPGPPHRVR